MAVSPPADGDDQETLGNSAESEGKKAGPPEGLDDWVKTLSERGMPIFARTAQDIGKVTSQIDSTASDLASTVLQDAAMTARLLRVANSPIFNVTGRTISTVSRAVVLLGFDEVRSICLSIAVVESMLRGPQKERVMDDMARSFHAAVQARSFAAMKGDKAAEEVFIATLLYQLGDMAFWTFSGPLGGKLDEALKKPGVNPAQVQKQVLGFELKDLTLGLTKEWNLGDMLQQALENKPGMEPRAATVVQGQTLARAAEQGWNSPQVKPLLKEIARDLSVSVEALTETVYENAEEAIKTASYYGAGKAGSRIPRPGTQESADVDVVPEEEVVTQKFLEPDPVLQLQILRELSTLLESKPDLNMLLEMVLEGVYRGIGMDRTLFAMRTPDKRFIKARYALGHDGDLLQRKFHFELSPIKANIFTLVMETCEPLWIRPPVDPKLKSLLTSAVQGVTEDAAFFVMPIEVGGQAIGLFYADRKTSGRPLDEDDYASFRHFGQQANMALTFITSRR